MYIYIYLHACTPIRHTHTHALTYSPLTRNLQARENERLQKEVADLTGKIYVKRTHSRYVPHTSKRTHSR